MVFLQKVKILLLVCSIKPYFFENSIDNSSIRILIFSLRLLFGTKDKIIPQRYFPFPPLGRIPPTPSRYLKTLTVVTYEQNFVKDSQVPELSVRSNQVLVIQVKVNTKCISGFCFIGRLWCVHCI